MGQPLIVDNVLFLPSCSTVPTDQAKIVGMRQMAMRNAKGRTIPALKAPSSLGSTYQRPPSASSPAWRPPLDADCAVAARVCQLRPDAPKRGAFLVLLADCPPAPEGSSGKHLLSALGEGFRLAPTPGCPDTTPVTLRAIAMTSRPKTEWPGHRITCPSLKESLGTYHDSTRSQIA